MVTAGGGAGGELITKIAKEIGTKIGKAATEKNRGKGWWYYTPLMAAASRAITQRIPLVDLVLDVRDARIPLSSECQLLRNYPASSSRRIVVLNKMDLANRSLLKDWNKYFELRGCVCCGVDSHNKDSVKQFLNFIQAQVRSMKKLDHSGYVTTIMMVGNPNVGKSALTNSLHHIGRISAAEKGKLKHAIVSPHPGETKDISSFKIGSRPNIYVLDTPGILPSEISDHEVCAKLALTGAITDCYVGKKELARYFLAVLSLSEEYKKWAKFTIENDKLYAHHVEECSSGHELVIEGKKQNPTDHTQDFIVQDVRRALFEAISCFDRNMQNGKDLEKLIEVQFTVLTKALWVSKELGNDTCDKVSSKLLNLYHIGRLGHYTLEIPAYKNVQDH